MNNNSNGSRAAAMAMVKVDVCGAPIDACRDGDTIWVVVRRVSEALGVQAHGQAARLKNKPWAVTQMICATGPDGKTYEMLCISHRSLPMWLATIEPSRSTSPKLRKLLERLQVEAADVLARHFFGEQSATPYTAEQMDRLTTALERIGAGMLVMSDRIDGLMARVSALEARIPADEPTIGKGKAKQYLLGPIHDAARLKARAFNQGNNRKVVNSFRFKYETDVREAVGFPRGAKMAMANLPVSRFSDACKAVLKVQGDAEGDAKTSRMQEQLSFPNNVVPMHARGAAK